MAKYISRWGLRYGGSILSATAGISGWLYLKHYGNVFMQSIRHGRMLVPAFAFPAVTAYAVNKMAIHQPLLLGNLDCSLCAETRAFVTQGICMTIQPFVASGLLNVIYAANYKNPILPNLLPLSGFMNFHKKVLLSSKQLTVFILLANFVITNVVTRQQTLDSIKVNNRLIHGHNFPKESDSEELPEEL